ncbi:hypothetical protein [Kingella potus]|nr:hypothetical protein [Kingella potus]
MNPPPARSLPCACAGRIAKAAAVRRTALPTVPQAETTAKPYPNSTSPNPAPQAGRTPKAEAV